MTNPSPPLLKMWEIALPIPLRIDAPATVLFLRNTIPAHCMANMRSQYTPDYLTTSAIAIALSW